MVVSQLLPDWYLLAGKEERKQEKLDEILDVHRGRS
jgi:hypothetical protein